MKKITALMAVAALGLAACGGSSYSSSSSTTAKTTASSSGGSGGGYGGGAAKTTPTSNSSGSAVNVKMQDNFFGTKVITGKPGSTIQVHLTNVGSNEHNFKIASQKAADADVKPGQNATVPVKIPTSGTVQFFCEYHKGLGMVGTVKAS